MVPLPFFCFCQGVGLCDVGNMSVAPRNAKCGGIPGGLSMNGSVKHAELESGTTMFCTNGALFYNKLPTQVL